VRKNSNPLGESADCRAVYFFTVLEITAIVQLAQPRSSFLDGKLHVGMPWISLSVGLNIVVTSMICFRLLRMRAVLREVLAPEMARMYTNVAAMLIESAAPTSILGVGVVITSARNGALAFAFGYVWNTFYVESESFPAHFYEYAQAEPTD
jgi:hypothetical protein